MINFENHKLTINSNGRQIDGTLNGNKNDWVFTSAEPHNISISSEGVDLDQSDLDNFEFNEIKVDIKKIVTQLLSH